MSSGQHVQLLQGVLKALPNSPANIRYDGSPNWGKKMNEMMMFVFSRIIETIQAAKAEKQTEKAIIDIMG